MRKKILFMYGGSVAIQERQDGSRGRQTKPVYVCTPSFSKLIFHRGYCFLSFQESLATYTLTHMEDPCLLNIQGDSTRLEDTQQDVVFLFFLPCFLSRLWFFFLVGKSNVLIYPICAHSDKRFLTIFTGTSMCAKKAYIFFLFFLNVAQSLCCLPCHSPGHDLIPSSSVSTWNNIIMKIWLTLSPPLKLSAKEKCTQWGKHLWRVCFPPFLPPLLFSLSSPLIYDTFSSPAM